MAEAVAGPAGAGEQLNNLALNDGDDDFVDPWNVSSKSETGIDYDKLISKYYRMYIPTINGICESVIYTL